MGKQVVVKGDSVKGTDTHNVTGCIASPPGPYTGVADFTYDGAMTEGLSDFVRIAGVPVALVTSRSSLNAGEAVAPTGKHSGPLGGNFIPTAPLPVPLSVKITDTPLGTGIPNSAAGSALLTVNGVKVLLDADKIDTCSGTGAPAGSAVTSKGQDFVTCSA
ncbi:hypothetical protein [Streptomyces sp. H27-D2]|uniref:hypothetical protein n=1 Tax=Streptomyces sp. H27-D2 TaxID=3046304 RepID=UPI002DBD0654|nr:hypothetical protein [Streptomyces sp. H27-D2]MEC4018807.1 hypothetical protein [Streptomyces sp. H27-D2]